MLTDLLFFIKLVKKPEVRMLGSWHLTTQSRVLNVILAGPSQVSYTYYFLVGRSRYPHIPFLFSIILTSTNSLLFLGKTCFWETGVSWVVISLEYSPLRTNLTALEKKLHF